MEFNTHVLSRTLINTLELEISPSVMISNHGQLTLYNTTVIGCLTLAFEP